MHDSVLDGSQVADDWERHWREFRAAAALSPATRYRRRLALRLWEQGPHPAPVRMLEIGSGAGEFAAAFLARHPGASYLGLELSHEAVEAAMRRAPAARFLERDLLQPAGAGKRLDFRASDAICLDVLEHVEDPRLLLRHASAYMAPGCRLIVTVPGGWHSDFYRHIGHRRHYTPGELGGLLASAGFCVEATHAAGFPFFNLYRMLVTWRGEALIADAARPPSLTMRISGALFDLLFHLNLRRRGGWQSVAIARLRAPPLTSDSAAENW